MSPLPIDILLPSLHPSSLLTSTPTGLFVNANVIYITPLLNTLISPSPFHSKSSESLNVDLEGLLTLLASLISFLTILVSTLPFFKRTHNLLTSYVIYLLKMFTVNLSLLIRM